MKKREMNMSCLKPKRPLLNSYLAYGPLPKDDILQHNLSTFSSSDLACGKRGKMAEWGIFLNPSKQDKYFFPFLT